MSEHFLICDSRQLVNESFVIKSDQDKSPEKSSIISAIKSAGKVTFPRLYPGGEDRLVPCVWEEGEGGTDI